MAEIYFRQIARHNTLLHSPPGPGSSPIPTTIAINNPHVTSELNIGMHLTYKLTTSVNTFEPRNGALYWLSPIHTRCAFDTFTPVFTA